MKKVVLASLLTAAAVVYAQQPVTINQGAPQPASGQVQMPQEEYNAYNIAMAVPDPKAKSEALEAYLQKYPQSQVKTSVLEQLMGAYSAFDPAKTLDAGDRLLQVSPNNLRALTIEATVRKGQADTLTDAAAKQAGYDKAAEYAQRALNAPKPDAMADADFQTIKTQVTPYLYNVIGIDALTKKDYPGAIAAYTAELKSVPAEQTKQPAPFLQDTFFLAQAYEFSTPPDYLKCAFYASRVVAYAPDQFKSQFQPTATYCFRKYHGADDTGLDSVKASASANVFYPDAGLPDVKAAPTAEDYVKQALAATPDLTQLAPADREFIILNGTQEEADRVFNSVKGKDVRTSGTVVSSTDTQVQLSVSDDAKQAKTADFTFTLKEPLKKQPAVGDTLELVGTFDSYTKSPVMLNLINAYPVAKPAATPTHRSTTTRR